MLRSKRYYPYIGIMNDVCNDVLIRRVTAGLFPPPFAPISYTPAAR